MANIPGKKTVRQSSVIAWQVVVNLVLKALLCCSMVYVGFASAENCPSKCDQIRFVGEAYSIKEDRLLYTETHNVDVDETGKYRSVNVAYADPSGKPFAEKTVDFTRSLTAPTIEFNDLRINELVVVSSDLGSKDSEMMINILRRSGQETSARSVKTKNPGRVVVDAGFDRFVALHWDELIAGEKKNFAFLAIDRAKLITFSIMLDRRQRDTVVFTVNPNNILVNLLVEPIFLTYDVKTRRLLEFKGLTNIEVIDQGKRSEKNYIARIRYRYLERL